MLKLEEMINRTPNKFRRNVLILHTDKYDTDFDSCEYVENCANALRTVGHKVKIVTANIIPLNICKRFHNFCYTMQSLLIATWIIIFAAFYRADIILVDLHYLALMLLRIFRMAPVIFFQYRMNEWSTKILSDELISSMSWAHDILVPSITARDILKRSYKEINMPVSILYPCPTTGQWNAAADLRRELVFPNIPTTNLIYLVITEMNLRGNIFFVVRAFRSFIQKLPSLSQTSVHLCILLAGNDSFNNYYFKQVKHYLRYYRFQENVHFYDMCDLKKRKAMMKYSHAFVNIVSDQIYNKYVIESLSLGKPIISTNDGYSCEILSHGYNSFLVTLNAKEYANAMYFIYKYRHSVTKYMAYLSYMDFEKNFSPGVLACKINNYVLNYTDNIKLEYVDDHIRKIRINKIVTFIQKLIEDICKENESICNESGSSDQDTLSSLPTALSIPKTTSTDHTYIINRFLNHLSYENDSDNDNAYADDDLMDLHNDNNASRRDDIDS